jgi:hypothetical protein
MLDNITEYYKKADGKTKKKILSCNFSKRPVLEKGIVVTFEFHKTCYGFSNCRQSFQKSGTKKEVENDLLFCLATLTGKSRSLFL